MDDLVKRLYEGAEGEAQAHRMITDSRYGPNYESMKPEHSIQWKAAARIIEIEAALNEFACSCPGVCERERNNAYAGKDSSCRAHDALSSNEGDGNAGD